MVNSSRKYHTKSRTGCGQCKKRHIKCDGRPPRCKNCERRDLVCEYSTLGFSTITFVPQHPPPPPPAPKSTASSSSPSATTAQSDPSSSPFTAPSENAVPSNPVSNLALRGGPRREEEAPELAIFTYRDLELMHHYTTQVADTLGAGILEAIIHEGFWQNKVPEAARHHHFLMHHLLSVSALHIAYQDDSQRKTYRDLGLAHYNTALRLFRNTLQTVSPDAFNPILASLVLTFVISMAFTAVLDPLDQPETLDTLMGPMDVLRRSSAFFGLVLNEVGPASVADDIRQAANRVPEPPSANVTGALDTLYRFNEASSDPPIDKLAYADAIKTLRTSFGFTTERPTSWQRGIFFPRVVSHDYFVLLQERKPMALAIFAHWCVPVHRAPYKWFFGNWAVRTVLKIAETLGDEWSPVLRWPLKEIASYRDLTEPVD